MFAIAFLALLLHGAIGPLDELQLCLAPLAVAIVLLVVKLWQARPGRRYDRARRRMGISNTGKKRQRL
jgi:hypothetical protein